MSIVEAGLIYCETCQAHARPHELAQVRIIKANKQDKDLSKEAVYRCLFCGTARRWGLYRQDAKKSH